MGAYRAYFVRKDGGTADLRFVQGESDGAAFDHALGLFVGYPDADRLELWDDTHLVFSYNQYQAHTPMEMRGLYYLAIAAAAREADRERQNAVSSGAAAIAAELQHLMSAARHTLIWARVMQLSLKQIKNLSGTDALMEADTVTPAEFQYSADPSPNAISRNPALSGPEFRSVASYERELRAHRDLEYRLRGALARDEALLRQKDALIIRLLNGLQFIASMLSLQSRATANARTKSRLPVAEQSSRNDQARPPSSPSEECYGDTYGSSARRPSLRVQREE